MNSLYRRKYCNNPQLGVTQDVARLRQASAM